MATILHIGMHKTGSSSIQNTLVQAPSTANFRYLSFGDTANSSHLVNMMFREAYSQTPVSERKHVPALRRRMAAKLDPTQLNFLSAEAICTLTAPEIGSLLDFFIQLDPDLRVLGYLRPPRSYRESSLQEILKNRYAEPALLKNFVRYIPTRNEITRRLGVGRVLFRPFDPARFPGGSVVNHVARVYGLTMDGLTDLRKNEGISLPALQLIAVMRHKFPDLRHDESKLTQVFSTLAGPKLRLSREAMPALAHAMQLQELASLRDEFGVDLPDDWATAPEDGIRDMDHLATPSPAALEWLAARTDSAVSALRDDRDAVALLVRGLLQAEGAERGNLSRAAQADGKPTPPQKDARADADGDQADIPR